MSPLQEPHHLSLVLELAADVLVPSSSSPLWSPRLKEECGSPQSAVLEYMTFVGICTQVASFSFTNIILTTFSTKNSVLTNACLHQIVIGVINAINAVRPIESSR